MAAAMPHIQKLYHTLSSKENMLKIYIVTNQMFQNPFSDVDIKSVQQGNAQTGGFQSYNGAFS